jgi:predicted hotdog family 3-hydroxylacyl-ACP dehydratase
VPEPDPLDRLPHSGNAKLLDRVVSLVPATRVVAEKQVAGDEHWLNADGFFPSMLLVELMAQGAGLLLEPDDARSDYAVLAGLRRMHLHGSVEAGQTIRVECSLTRQMGDVYLVSCASFSGGRPLAHGRIQLRRVRRESP